MKVSFETITPEIAKEYLKHNNKNRTVKPQTVESYARDILRGEFITTHQGIAFDVNGELADGQHRLLAIVLTGVPVSMMVTRGVPVNAVLAIDRGVSRSVRDTIIIDAKNDAGLGCQIIGNQKVISALSQLVACSYKRTKMTTFDTKKVYNEFSESVEQIYEEVISKNRISCRAPMLAAAIASLNCGVDIGAIIRFFNVFEKDDVTGCSEYNVQAALNLKRQIDDAKIHKVFIDRKKLYLLTQNAIYHFSNNTSVSRIVAPIEPRYDVSDRIKEALCVGVSEYENII